MAQQQAADTVPERVAGGEDRHPPGRAGPAASGSVSASGERQASRSRPSSGSIARCRSPPTRTSASAMARAGLGAEPVQPVGADADDGEPGHGGSTKSALTAAAAMALPPRRPRSVIQGTSRPLSIRASLLSAAPTNPTGKARIAAGRSGQSRKPVREDGTAPWAHCRSRPRRRRDAGARARPRRPIGSCARSAASAGGPLIVESEHDPDCAAGSRPVITPAATILASTRIGAPRASAARPAATGSPCQARSSAISGMPQAWTSRSTRPCRAGGKRSSGDLGPDQGEGTRVDGVRVTQIVGHRPGGRPQPAPLPFRAGWGWS